MKAFVIFLAITILGLFIILPDLANKKWQKSKIKVNEFAALEPTKPDIPIDITLNKPVDFTAEGLNYEAEIMDIYMGNFADVPWQNDEMILGLLLHSYINSFAKRCDAYLPDNKEMLYDQECAEKQITKNGYGMIISETCIKYRKVPLYLYVAPDMARAMEEIDANQLKWVGDIMRRNDGLGTSAKLMGETKAVSVDMARLVQMNPCDSPGLKNFQENLRRYVLGMEPIRVEKLIAERKTKIVELSINQDVQKLLEDLVYQNSRQWNFNRYQKGSVQDVNIISTDTKGRPYKIKGFYTYSGFSGSKKGSVILTFDGNGMPDCLYFYDFPTTCRPANRKIVNNYAQNNYASNASNEAIYLQDNLQTNIVNRQTNQERNNIVPFAVVEHPPAYPGCENLQTYATKKCSSEKISQFVNNHFDTKLAKDLGLSGINKVIVQFRINQEGIIDDIRVRASHPELEKEAVRVIKLIPKMIPATQRGKPVDVMYSLPITFQVVNDNQTFLDKTTDSSDTKKAEKIKASNNNLRQLFKLKKDNRRKN